MRNLSNPTLRPGLSDIMSVLRFPEQVCGPAFPRWDRVFLEVAVALYVQDFSFQ
jgi:hypothetical protein